MFELLLKFLSSNGLRLVSRLTLDIGDLQFELALAIVSGDCHGGLALATDSGTATDNMHWN